MPSIGQSISHATNRGFSRYRWRKVWRVSEHACPPMMFASSGWYVSRAHVIAASVNDVPGFAPEPGRLRLPLARASVAVALGQQEETRPPLRHSGVDRS